MLALLLLTDGRRPARTNAAGELVLLEDQDRGLWDRALIAEGETLLLAALTAGRPGPYQLSRWSRNRLQPNGPSSVPG